jgi:hypothetical protein
MYYKINLHTHSDFSDGSNTIRELAIACKELNHSCLVITDHLYSKSEGKTYPEYSLTPQSFNRQILESHNVSIDLNYPIINGIELSVKGYEEVLVFGTEAIRDIFRIREEKGSIGVNDLAYVRSRHNYDCAIILCHPMNAKRFISKLGHLVIDGYEFIHNRRQVFRSKDPYERFKLKRVCNSDAHGVRQLRRCCNIISTLITNEQQLIDYILNPEVSFEFCVQYTKEELEDELVRNRISVPLHIDLLKLDE